MYRERRLFILRPDKRPTGDFGRRHTARNFFRQLNQEWACSGGTEVSFKRGRVYAQPVQTNRDLLPFYINYSK